MDETFENRPILDSQTLRVLKQRRDLPSLLRLTLHLGAFFLGATCVVLVSRSPILASASGLLLAAIWAALFAPFHECTHLTAFRSRQLNVLGAWLTGPLFGFSPSVYRAFHFAHHRYTHDPERDPEILAAPERLASWPEGTFAWLGQISGIGDLRLKSELMLKFSLLPASRWNSIAPWAPQDQRSRMAWETRLVALSWLALGAVAMVGIRGTRWLVLAAILSNSFQALWLTTEHKGLPSEGTILERTRTLQTSAFVRWWLWNMNYHAEHHAWPAVPWHCLPAVHRQVVGYLDHVATGYGRLQLKVLWRRNLPDGVIRLEQNPCPRSKRRFLSKLP